MAAIYNAYYETVIEGQDRMKDLRVALPPESVVQDPTEPRGFWGSVREKFFPSPSVGSGDSGRRSNMIIDVLQKNTFVFKLFGKRGNEEEETKDKRLTV